MHLIIAKVNEVLFDGEAESLTVPGAAGEMTILGEHEPLITILKEGIVTVREKNVEQKVFPILGGAAEVRRDGVTIIL
jgi:F-type H+-transporting ATPase subunit epsilon